MSDTSANGTAWVARNLVSIIIIVTAIAGVGGNWYVTGDRIENLRADFLALRTELQAASGRLYAAERTAGELNLRVQWLERLATTRSSLEPPPRPSP